MSTWQEQVQEWHDASLRMKEKLETLNDVLQIAPDSGIYESVNALIDGWMQQLQRAHNLGDWLDYWAWACDYGRAPCRPGAAYFVMLSDGSKWSLDSIDDLLGMLERHKQINVRSGE